MPLDLADLVDVLASSGVPERSPVLHLFRGPAVTFPSGLRHAVPEGSQRLLVFVALRRARVGRRHAAGCLWPTGDDARAAGNLRSALWRLNRARMNVLVADKSSLAMRPDVLLDLDVIGEWAARLIGGRATGTDLAVMPTGVEALELLPGWYDDWVLLERERIRQRLLHALEALSRQYRLAGRCAEAVEAALLAVNAEPLRESAQRVLVEAHLAEGNWVEGRRNYLDYRDRLRRELGVEPSAEFRHLLAGERPAGPPTLPACAQCAGRRACEQSRGWPLSPVRDDPD
jgi:DNA-binding SARP family transcriptional activator